MASGKLKSRYKHYIMTRAKINRRIVGERPDIAIGSCTFTMRSQPKNSTIAARINWMTYCR